MKVGKSVWLVVALVPWMTGCELQEITLAESKELIVAEVYVSVDASGVYATAWIHRTQGSAPNDPAPTADVFLRSEFRGSTVRLGRADAMVCTGDELPPGFKGSCYFAGPLEPRYFGPGAFIEAVVRLPGEGRITGETRVPSAYDFVRPVVRRQGMCSLEPSERFTVEWTRAEGAWAYISETQIDNLTAALEDTDIEVVEDPLLLVGLSVSEADTTIVFPSEFGLFDRANLSRELAVELQNGLPFGTQADVVVAAADRNYVNWVRRGVFNPSGIVRIPSLFGDGTGVFGSVVRRRFIVDVGLEVPAPPPCAASPE